MRTEDEAPFAPSMVLGKLVGCDGERLNAASRPPGLRRRLARFVGHQQPVVPVTGCRS